MPPQQVNSTSNGMGGSCDQRARGFPSAAIFPKSELSADVTRKLAVLIRKATIPPARRRRNLSAIAADAHEDPKVQREALLESADLYAKANNSPKAVAMLEKVRRFPSHAGRRCGGSAPAPRRTMPLTPATARARRTGSGEIVQADAQAGAATHRPHPLSCRQGANPAGRPGARCLVRNVKLVLPLKKSLIAKRKALDTALALYKHALDYPGCRSHDRRDLRDGGAVPYTCEGHHGFGASEESLQGMNASSTTRSSRSRCTRLRSRRSACTRPSAARAKARALRRVGAEELWRAG